VLFRSVLVKELQGLGLDVEVQYDDGTIGGMVLEDEDEEKAMRKSYEHSASAFFFDDDAKDDKGDAPLDQDPAEPPESEELADGLEILDMQDLFSDKDTLPSGMSLVEEGAEETWPEER
jgi:DNA-directed RNA polymerase subunit beta